MAAIKDYLSQIITAVYGKDVRQAIHDAINQCYTDGKAATTVKTATINEDGELILTLQDESTIDCGKAKGDKGDIGDTGPEGPKGEQGETGPAPTVTVKRSGKVVTITIGSETFTLSDGNDGEGSGDMLKATYDTNGDGVVDNSAQLDGHDAGYFATASHSHTIADVTGLQDALDTKTEYKMTYADGTLTITG